MAMELMVDSEQNYTWDGDYNNTMNQTSENTRQMLIFWQVS